MEIYDELVTSSGRSHERQFLITYASMTDPMELIDDFVGLSYFESVTVNKLLWLELQGTNRLAPGDTTLFSGQWYLDNTDTGDKSDIDAPEAWAIERGDPNLVVGIYDSGTMVDRCTGTLDWRLHSDFNHFFLPEEDVAPAGVLRQSDLNGVDANDDSDTIVDNVIGINVADGCTACGDQGPLSVWKPLPLNWLLGDSFQNLDCPPAATSWEITAFHTHGVRVGAIAVGKLDGLKKKHPSDVDITHKDIVGVANQCKVYNARFRCPTGDAQAAIALRTLAEYCKVINMSFGQFDYDDFSGGSDEFRDAIKTVTSEPHYDCVLVAAVGNNSRSDGVIYPARFDSVLAVGAISRFDGSGNPNPLIVDY